MTTPCPGPFIWFDVEATEHERPGAVLECATCRDIVTTGNFMDARHTDTPFLREGLSA